MNRSNILMGLDKCGVIAVVRGETKEVAINIAESCIKGNVKGIEITYTNKYANEVVLELSKRYKNRDDVLIGAGTVLDSETARMAILAGADYIVSPSFNDETAKICNRYNIPYIPGVMTITEIVRAYEHGVDVVKVFPGNALNQSYIKSIRGPLPYVNIMVTGGVNINNIGEWIKSGANLVGIGGELNTLGEQGEFKKIETICSNYIAKLKEARGV